MVNDLAAVTLIAKMELQGFEVSREGGTVHPPDAHTIDTGIYPDELLRRAVEGLSPRETAVA